MDTATAAGNHNISLMAAGVAYYAILSIFPLLLGLIAIFGLFLPSVNLQNELLKFVGKNLPAATDILKQNIEIIVKLRGAAGILSIVILFWGASGMFGAISLAINRAWDIHRYRPFLIRKASELGMALSMSILFLLSIGVGAIGSILYGISELSSVKLIIVYIGTRLVAFLLIFGVFILLYKCIPYTKTFWRYVWLRSFLATTLFEIARTLFIFYFEKFTNYQLIYGSITSIIALLVWIYYSAFIMILGAEFTYQHTRVKSSVAVESNTDK